MPSLADGPVMVQSGDLQFGPQDRIHHRRVESRFALGCLSGRGTVTVNARRIEVTPASLHLLPWGHEIEYAPDAEQPFRVWGLHLVPRHRAGVPVVMRAAHNSRDPLSGSADRRDGPVGPSGIVTGSTSERPALLAFGLYALELWRLDALVPGSAFALGAIAARVAAATAVAAIRRPRGAGRARARTALGEGPSRVAGDAPVDGSHQRAIGQHPAPTVQAAPAPLANGLGGRASGRPCGRAVVHHPSQRRRGGPCVRLRRPAVLFARLHQSSRGQPHRLAVPASGPDDSTPTACCDRRPCRCLADRRDRVRDRPPTQPTRRPVARRQPADPRSEW